MNTDVVGHAFSSAAPQIWNRIPTAIRVSPWLLQTSPQNSLLCLAITRHLATTLHLWFIFLNFGPLPIFLHYRSLYVFSNMICLLWANIRLCRVSRVACLSRPILDLCGEWLGLIQSLVKSLQRVPLIGQLLFGKRYVSSNTVDSDPSNRGLIVETLCEPLTWLGNAYSKILFSFYKLLSNNMLLIYSKKT